MQNVLIVINLLLFTLIMTKHTVRQNRRGFFSTHRFSLHDILQSSQKKTESRRLVVGHGLTTFSATKIFCTILCFFWAQPPAPLRQHFGTTWPDHFSKADCDPGTCTQLFHAVWSCGFSDTRTHRQTNVQTYGHSRNVRRILVRGPMSPCRLRRRKFWKSDYEMVHSKVHLKKICGQHSAVLYTLPALIALEI